MKLAASPFHGPAEPGDSTTGDYDKGAGYGSVTFGANDSAATVRFPTHHDGNAEAPKTLTLQLVASSGAQAGAAASTSVTDDLRIVIGKAPLTVGLVDNLPVTVTKADGTSPGAMTLTVVEYDGAVVVPQVTEVSIDAAGHGILPVLANGAGEGHVALQDAAGNKADQKLIAVPFRIFDVKKNEEIKNFSIYFGQQKTFTVQLVDAKGLPSNADGNVLSISDATDRVFPVQQPQNVGGKWTFVVGGKSVGGAQLGLEVKTAKKAVAASKRLNVDVKAVTFSVKAGPNGPISRKGRNKFTTFTILATASDDANKLIDGINLDTDYETGNGSDANVYGVGPGNGVTNGAGEATFKIAAVDSAGRPDSVTVKLKFIAKFDTAAIPVTPTSAVEVVVKRQ